MAKPNYSYEKHMRDLNKKKKKEAKRLKKLAARSTNTPAPDGAAKAAPASTPPTDTTAGA